MWILWVASAWAATPAEQAWEQLARGDAQGAWEASAASYRQDPAMASVRVLAEQRLFDPRKAAATCTELMNSLRGPWAAQTSLAKTCGWQFVRARVNARGAERCFNLALAADEWDQDARSGLLAARNLETRPVDEWGVPRPEDTVRARRKRDFIYLYRYLRPEDGLATVGASWTALPGSNAAELRAEAYFDLYLRGHELVLAGYRGRQQFAHSDGELGPRPASHQLYGGYRLTIFSRTPMQLDGSWIVGKGTDEAAVRFRIEQVGLGVWSADLAAVHSPWGTHGALRVGWSLTFDGLGTFDARVEGQIGTGTPRGLARLAFERELGSVTIRLDGQYGRAARPLEARFLVTDLPGLEGAGATLSLAGNLSKRWSVVTTLAAKQLHEPTLPQADDPQTAGQVGVLLRRSW